MYLEVLLVIGNGFYPHGNTEFEFQIMKTFSGQINVRE